jgi:hypothetical protein
MRKCHGIDWKIIASKKRESGVHTLPHRSFLFIPPGRLERPHMAPEATALSTELRGLTDRSLTQSARFSKQTNQ